MRVFCAGFNLFGQFSNIEEQCVERFTCAKFLNAIDLHISHAYLISKTAEFYDNNTSQKYKVNLHGFLRNDIHQSEELNFNSNEIVQFSVSDCRALFLTKQQQIYCFQYNINSDYILRLLPAVETDQNKEEDREGRGTIKKITSGICMSNAYSDSGFVYNLPLKLDYKTLQIKDICTGREHCLILSHDGSVYSFGGGSRGQLGHGDVEDKDVPEQIKCLEGIKVSKIACGAWHSVALSADGDVYTWGWNSNGQLGLDTNKNQLRDIAIIANPQVIELDTNITDICCGSRHTIILSENLKLFGCGWNKYCQLGFKSKNENNFSFTFLYDFSEFNIIGLRCGTWNTTVLVSD